MKKLAGVIVILTVSFYIYSLESDINQIKTKIKDKKSIEQVIALEKYIASSPENISLYILKAEIELKNKDYVGAKDTLLKAYAFDKTNTQVLNFLGMSNYHMNRFYEAAFYFNETLKQESNNQFASGYISLLNPFSDPANAFTDTKEKTVLIVKKLAESIQIGDDVKKDFVYLLNKKEINLINDKTLNYTIHCVVKILTKEGINSFRDFYYSYNAFEYQPYVEKAGSYDSNYNFKAIDNKNIVFVDKKDASSTSLYTNRKYVAFPIPDIKIGSIVEYRINFNSTGKSLSTKLFDQFVFGSNEKIYESEYSINYPKDLYLKLATKGSGFTVKEKTSSGRVEKTFNFRNPPLYNLHGESITIYDLSPQVFIGTFKSWDEIAQWYSSVFEDVINNTDFGGDILKELDLDKKSKIQKTEAIYEFIQKNIHYVAVELAESALKPREPLEVYKNKFGDCKDQAILFIYLLRKAGIEANPVLVSTLDNGPVEKEMPSPFFFNHVITFIPKQTGIENEYFLDTTSRVTPFGNLPSSVQGVNVFIVNKNGNGVFKETPLISSDKNKIEEYFKMQINSVGNGSIRYTTTNTGSYSELLRYSFQNKSKEEILNYFFNMQKKSFPNIKKEDLIIDGIDNQSGDVSINVASVEQGLTNIFYDGKQKISFNLKEAASLFNFPNKTQYDYRKNFGFVYQKTIEYIFPEGYSIVEGEIKNIKRENEYIDYEIIPEFIQDNHFKIKISLTLKKRMIKNDDLQDVNSFLQTVLKDTNFDLVVQNNKNFDWESFYDELSIYYKQKEVYENYVRKLLEMKKTDKVIEVCGKAIKLFPDNIYFYLLKGTVLSDNNDFAQAESVFKDGLAEEPFNLDLYTYLIELYKKSRDDLKLEAVLLEVSDKFPSNTVLVREILSLYKRNEMYDNALIFLDKMLVKNPENSYFYSEKGFFYSVKKDLKKAEESFLKSIKYNDKNASALNNLAWLYCEFNVNIDKAVLYAEQACELDPYNDAFLDTLGEAYFISGLYDPAIQTISKAIKLNPNYTYLQMQLEKIEKAKKMKEKSN